MAFIIIYITCQTTEEAEKIAGALLAENLIACANIMAPHTALYRWKGQTERAQECAIIMKTRSNLFDKVKEKIAGMHSYECPCVVSWPIERGYAPFLDWIAAETAG
jgi:periplasmic divalent cation tolerance protein